MRFAVIAMATRRNGMPGSWLQLASGLAGLRSPLDAAAAVLAGQPGGARAIAAQPAQRQQAKLRDPEPAEDEDFSRDLAEMEAVAQRVAGRASPARAAPAKRAEREADAAEDVEDVEDLSAGEAAAKNSVPIDNFTISQRTKDVLKKKRGIQGLFPIQAACFEAAFSGKDVIGRAKTGTGKTLAFALPLVERLLQAGREHRGRGRSPRVLVMCPTRELARQIASEFASICDSQGLAVLAVYGGSPFGPQESAFRMGVDIVVGTPGRLLDHMSRGTLKLEEIRSFVMDEADMMLDMGFVEDMDEVLNAVKKARNSSDPLQTLLFSATFPEWVKKTSDRFLRRSETTTIDLVGNDDAKMADTIRHYAIPIAPSGQQDALMARTQTLADAIRAFSKKDRTLVFTSTKREVDLIVEALQGRFANTIGCRAAGLHGDVDQSRREHILAAFRSGSVPVLVATDVAARGLDIPATNLVVHFTPPTNQESFIHRSGRTGRANQAGTSITLFTPRGPEEYAVKDLAKFAGITFTQTVVQPRDIIAEVAREAMDKIYKVPAHVVKSYEPFARKLLEEKAEGDPVRAVAMAVAAVVETSHHHVQGAKHTPAGPVHTRGVLSGREGFTCLMAVNCHSESELRAALDNAELPATVRNAILSSAMLSLRNRSVEGVVMEVPSDDAELVIQKLEELEVEEVEEVTCELRPLIRGGYKDSGDYGYGRRGGSRYGDDRGYRRDRGYGKDRDYGRDRDYRSRDRDRGGFRSAKTDFGSRTSVRWMSIYSRMA